METIMTIDFPDRSPRATMGHGPEPVRAGAPGAGQARAGPGGGRPPRERRAARDASRRARPPRPHRPRRRRGRPRPDHRDLEPRGPWTDATTATEPRNARADREWFHRNPPLSPII